jgi:hypothetical protein
MSSLGLYGIVRHCTARDKLLQHPDKVQHLICFCNTCYSAVSANKTKQDLDMTIQLDLYALFLLIEGNSLIISRKTLDATEGSLKIELHEEALAFCELVMNKTTQH